MDYVKRDSRRHELLRASPDLVIVVRHREPTLF
jgi:hypothetical protein